MYEGEKANVVELRPRAKNAFGLRFDTQDDALHYAREIGDFGVSLQRKSGHFGINYYLCADSDLFIRLRRSGSNSYFIVGVRLVKGSQGTKGTTGLNHYCVDELDQREIGTVFGCAGQFRQDPNHLVFPMLVRFKRTYEVKQGRIDPSAFSFNLTFEPSRVLAHGEVNAFGVRASELHCGVAHCIVQCASEFTRNIGGEAPFVDRHPSESDIQDILSSLRIGALDDVFLVDLSERFQTTFELCNICLRGADAMQRTFEGAEVVDETDL